MTKADQSPRSPLPTSEMTPEQEPPLTIQYDVVNAADVVAHWMRGYAEGLSRTVLQEYDWFYDSAKAAFVFKLFTRSAK